MHLDPLQLVLAQGAVAAFVPILLAEVIRGIGETCLSGARQAWLAGEVGAENVGPIMLRGVQTRRIASLVGIAASVGLANLDLRLPIVTGGALSLLLAIGLLVAMPEHGFQPVRRSRPLAMRTTITTAFDVMRKNPLLLQLCALAAILGAASEGFDRLWEAHILTNFALPTVGELGPVTWFGLINAGGLLLPIAAVHIVRRMNTSDDRVLARMLLVLQLLRAGAIGVLALTSQLGVAIVARWTTQGLESVSAPLLDAWLARNSPSSVRATVFSAIGQSDALGQVLGGPGIGVVGTLLSLRAAILASAMLLLPGVWLLNAAARNNVSSKDAVVR